MTSKTFCPLPWIHMATRPNGDVRVCCTANASGAGLEDNKTAGLVKKDGIAMNLRDHTIEEVWNSDHMKQTRLQMLKGEIPTSCTKCFEEESKGVVSKRQWETREWETKIDIQSIVDKTAPDGSLEPNIPYFDLRLGNVCNLKCVMCSPHDSSSWIKDWKLQQPNYKNELLASDQDWDQDFDYTWYKKGSFLDSMMKQSANIKQLYFAGGEPLMIPEHWNILRELVANGHAKNIKLRYNTNGHPPSTRKAVNYWNQFKDVVVNFSIDGTEFVNNYIRYPSVWKDTYEAFLYITQELDKNHQTNIACAVQALNALDLTNLARWSRDANQVNNKRTHMAAPFINTHFVYLPSYLNIKVLPIEIKNKVRRQIEDFLLENIKDNYFNDHPMGRQRWEGIIKYMYSEDWSSKLPALVEYLDSCDKTRGTNWRETFPELANSIDGQ